MKSAKKIIAVLLMVAAVVVAVPGAFALPFNDDMVGGQLITGTIMRPRPPETVPVGAIERHIPSREVALQFANPMKNDPSSAVRGERLFAVNCSPCHGSYSDGKYVVPPMGQMGLIPPVNLVDENIVFTDGAARKQPKSDGHIFGYVYFGGLALMPAYGWKLSNHEIWDVVNYVRSVQALAGTAPGSD